MGNGNIAALNGASFISLFDRRKRSAILIGVCVGILCWILPFLVYASLKYIRHHSTFIDLLTLLVQSMYVGAPVIGYITYSRIARTRGMLIWLRRFRHGYGSKVRFHRPLAFACSAMLSPVTIQDSSFKTSFFTALLRSWILFPFLSFLWLIGITFILMPASILSPSLPMIGALMALWTGFYIWAVWAVLKHKGFKTMHGETAQVRASRYFQSLSGGGDGKGFEIYKCDDDIWQNIVSEALKSSKVAIIDISDPTENILWELSEALKHLNRDCILLAIEERNETLDYVASDVQKRLSEASHQLPLDWIREALFLYPAFQERPGPARGKQYAILGKRLRNKIADVLIKFEINAKGEEGC